MANPPDSGLPPQQQWAAPQPAPVPSFPGGQGLPLAPAEPAPPPEAGAERPSRKRRSITFTEEEADKVVDTVLDRLNHARDERASWMDFRLVRYAKLRGWRQEQSWPWEGAHNEHIPMMQANSLRVQAGLFNAVMGNRPIMQGRSLRRDKMDAAEKAADLIEYQLMMEADGEKKIGQAIMQFVNDGTLISFQPWVRDTRQMVDVRVVPAAPAGTSLKEHIAGLLPDMIHGLSELTAKTDAGEDWTGKWDGADGEHEVTIAIYDRDDDQIDVEMRWDSTVFDGPTTIIHRLEDIIVPLRSQNCQPVTPENPFGATWINRVVKVDLDTIARRKKDGTYDLLSDEDFNDLVAEARQRASKDETYQEDRLTEEKEAQAGLNSDWSGLSEDRRWLTMNEWYGRWDVDGDGLEEDVIFWITREGEKLCRARYLTEMHPGSPPQRPFAEARFIEVDDAFYGIGLPELMEGVSDLLHDLVNSNLDRGDIANLPVMLYRSASGIKPEQMSVKPGDWVPVDNPQTDALPVQYPHSDQSWSFNMISLVQQLGEKLIQIGPLQFGQVPQGKASALRTVGTTMAILQQGAALPEQILRRFFHWLRQVYEQFHMLNTRFLPKEKQYLIAGKPLDSEDAYAVATPQDIALPVSFDFQATLLNTNKGIVSQSLTSLGTALFNPLALQMKITGPEQFYQWAKDLVNANQLDPMRYIQRPPGVSAEPPITGNDAISILLEGRMPGLNLIEGPQAALESLQLFVQGDDFGRLHPNDVGLFREYMSKLSQLAQQAQAQQAMLQAAQQFQQQMGNQGQGQGGAPGGPGTVPEMQSEPGTASELMGAQGGPGA